MEDCLRDILICCDKNTLIIIQLLPYRTILNRYFWQQKFIKDIVPDYVHHNLEDYSKYVVIYSKYKQLLLNRIYLDIKDNDVIDFINLHFTNTDNKLILSEVICTSID